MLTIGYAVAGVLAWLLVLWVRERRRAASADDRDWWRDSERHR